MDISLVICTRNRAKYLSEVLHSLTKMQGNIDWELVVVNNGSTDETGEILNKFRQQFSHPFQIVNEPKPGLGRARNSGWQIAHGRVVAFTDDDCYPANDYLHRMLECFEREDIGFVGGRILLYDPTDYPITIQPCELSMELSPGDFAPAGLIQGANFAFRRTALEIVNGFDDRMGCGTPFACEDVEILARLLAKGYKGIYNPQPLIFHHHRRKTEAEASALMKTYDIARGAYYAKCLMNPALRRMCAQNWYWSVRQERSMSRFARELIGTIHYVLRLLFARS